LLAWRVRVRDAFDIKNDGDTGNDPLGGRVLRGPEEGHEDEVLTTELSHVDWALIDVLLDLAVLVERRSLAVDDREDGEGLLRQRLIQLHGAVVPSRTFDLEAEDVSTFLAVGQLLLPIEVLEDDRVDVQLVEL
jgi:hypothetical protein